METLRNIQTVYFLGIGGIGMSALARWFRAQGARVSGYDRTPSAITRSLQEEGINVHFEDNASFIPEELDLVVYTPAIPEALEEFQVLKESETPMKKRSEILGMISAETFTIAIAGTHGKTSITSLIAWMFRQAGKPITAFIGGISKNFGSNLVLDEKPEVLVVEADEFDRSFLRLKPNMAVISSMDADHLDIYGSREELLEAYRVFVRGINPQGVLVRNERVPEMTVNAYVTTYGESTENDCYYSDLEVAEGKMKFTLNWKGESIPNLRLNVPGRHNLENAVAASAICLSAGIGPEMIRKSLRLYEGVQRRFDYRIQRDDLVYIDDYAHHPEELEALIKSVRELYPGKSITGIFQPHLYSRTRDFADGFARSLDLLDEPILMDIYPARETPIPDVDSGMILRRMENPRKKLMTRTDILTHLEDRKPDVLLTIGAGDIDRLVGEIEKVLNIEEASTEE